MSFVPGDLVWTDFGTWHPGIVGTPDQLPTQGAEGQIPVIFSDGSGAHMDPGSVEPFSVRLEERKAVEEIAALWDTFMALVESRNGGKDQPDEDGEDDEDDLLLGGGDDDADDEEAARRKAEKKEAKRLRKEEKEARKKAEKEAKEAAKKAKKEAKKSDNDAADEIAALLDEEGGALTDDTPVDRLQRGATVKKSQIAGAQHLEQQAGVGNATVQLSLIRAHYNNVLASEVAGTSTRLMPFLEKDYLATAERAIQRRARTERFLALALKKADEEGKGHTPAAKAIKESHDALRSFDLTKAFALPMAGANAALHRQVAADAVELRTVGRGLDAAPGAEKMKHVTRLYYRDQLTSIADGTSLVPVESTPARGIRRSALADPMSRLGPAGTQSLSQGGGALLTGRFASSSQVAPILLQATNETNVMTQWRLFRDLPPREDGYDAQYIPPVGAIAQRFDEAGQALWKKAYNRTVKALRDDDELILTATAQTTEARLGLNIGYNDIPAAGGPPAGPEDVADMDADRDVISRQLRELGETFDRQRSDGLDITQLKTQRKEAAQTLLELTQRAGLGIGLTSSAADGSGAAPTAGVATQSGGVDRPATQFNFHDFGATAAQKREQRATMGSVEYNSNQHDANNGLFGSHLIGTGSPNMPNPLTPVNYGYDIDDAYRTVVPDNADAQADIRSLHSNDLPSVNSLWERGSIAVGAAGPTPRGSQNGPSSQDGSSAANSGGAINPQKTVREIFLKEARTLTTTIERLLAQGNAATAYRSASSGHVVKYSTLRDVYEYLRDISNIRAIVEKLTTRAVEQMSGQLAVRDPSAPLFTSREAMQLAASFRRQIERAHRLDRDGLAGLVPSNISRPNSDARSAAHSESARSAVSRHSRSTAGVSVRSSAVGQRRSRERAYDE